MPNGQEAKGTPVLPFPLRQAGGPLLLCGLPPETVL